MSSEFRELYKRFHFVPHDESLYVLAFTHSSYNGVAGTRHQDYERLEFLGDSVVGMVTTELCYKNHPDMGQGDLSVLKSQFICTKAEAHYCLGLGLDKYIRVGASYQNKISDDPRLLEDIFESFIGALFLDQGLEFTYSFVKAVYEEDIKDAKINASSNPKSSLQEAMQAERKESVTYKIIGEEGPSHERVFVAAVYFENDELGRGIGRSKKEAETAAASDALAKMAKMPEKGK